jgi:hypothetical protein
MQKKNVDESMQMWVQTNKSRPKIYTLQVENTKLSTLKHRKYNLIFKNIQKKLHERM